MKGLWQTKLSGYNHKNTYRKKNTRKHLIKDNIKSILYKDKHIKSSTLKNTKDDYEIVFDKVKQEYIPIIVKVFKERRFKHNGYEIYLRKKTIEAIKHKYKLYDIYTKKELNFKDYIIVDSVNSVSTCNSINNIVLPTKSNNVRGISDKRYLYGRPLNPNWDNIYGFWNTRRKKFIRLKANRQNRKFGKEYCRNIVHNENYVLKTNYLSKSIAYEVW